MNRAGATTVRALVAAGTVAVLSTIGCGDSGGGTVALLGTVGGLAETVPAAPAQTEAWSLDRRDSHLVPIVAGGASQAGTVPVEPPPIGWQNLPVPLFRLDATHVAIYAPWREGRWYHATVDIERGTTSSWLLLDGRPRLLPWDGAVARIEGGTATFTSTTRLLPPDARTLPDRLGDAGFPYATSDGKLAWWDPLTAGVRWRADVGAIDGHLAHGQNRVAWTAGAEVVTASANANRLRAPWRAPLEAAPVRLRFSPTRPSELWLATADAQLHRVHAGSESGFLCYHDTDSIGAQNGSVSFADVGRLSDPQLVFQRLGRSEDCRGWALADDWTLVYEGVPAAWQRVTVAPGATTGDLPYPAWVTIGDALVRGDGAAHAVTATAPLGFEPPLDGRTAGAWTPRGRWLVRTARRGELGLVATDAEFAVPDLALVVRAGTDAADPGDTFLFTIRNGATGVQGGTAFTNWEELVDGTVVALDRKANTAYIVNRGGSLLGTAR